MASRRHCRSAASPRSTCRRRSRNDMPFPVRQRHGLLAMAHAEAAFRNLDLQMWSAASAQVSYCLAMRRTPRQTREAPMNLSGNEILNARETAAFLRISPRTLDRLCQTDSGLRKIELSPGRIGFRVG